jgi:hypothetical protein
MKRLLLVGLLLAALSALACFPCAAQTGIARLLRAERIHHFPSSSTIQWFNRRLYVVGDDSRNILVLDRNYQTRDSISIFNGEGIRVPRSSKADIEGSAIVQRSHSADLILIGSGSSPNRAKCFVVSLDNPSSTPFREFDLTSLINAVPDSLRPVNFEGAALIDETIILVNRRNQRNGVNYLLLTGVDSFLRAVESNVSYRKILLSDSLQGRPGVSDFSYVEALDILLVTLTTESTWSSTEDGPIGDSYLAWIPNFKQSLGTQGEISFGGLINLSSCDSEMKGQKIEGVCVERAHRKKIRLHLVSDNDNGESHIFKIELRLKPNLNKKGFSKM